MDKSVYALRCIVRVALYLTICQFSVMAYDGDLANTYSFTDDELNAAYSLLLNSLPADQQAKLRGVERAWIKYRDLCSEFEAAQNGSHDWGAEYDCKIRLTQERTERIKQMLGEVVRTAGILFDVLDFEIVEGNRTTETSPGGDIITTFDNNLRFRSPALSIPLMPSVIEEILSSQGNKIESGSRITQLDPHSVKVSGVFPGKILWVSSRTKGEGMGVYTNAIESLYIVNQNEIVQLLQEEYEAFGKAGQGNYTERAVSFSYDFDNKWVVCSKTKTRSVRCNKSDLLSKGRLVQVFTITKETKLLLTEGKLDPINTICQVNVGEEPIKIHDLVEYLILLPKTQANSVVRGTCPSESYESMLKNLKIINPHFPEGDVCTGVIQIPESFLDEVDRW